MQQQLINWIVGGIIGATAYATLKELILPIVADLLFYKTPSVRGRWNARIIATTPDGLVHHNSEVVFVRQLGNKIWGHTEIGADPLLAGLEAGNKFSGRIERTTIILTFKSRNKRSPYNGVFLGTIESERFIKGYDIAKLDSIWPIKGEFSLVKVSS
jgi:hypothetical protein